MKLTFDIFHPGEPEAVIMPITDTITVEVKSGDPGGEQGEFEMYMIDLLSSWYGGARVESLKVRRKF